MGAPFGARRIFEGRRPRVAAADLLPFVRGGGDIFLPHDASTVFSDNAGTVPAVTDDPVGRIVGQAGNFYLASTADGNRPLWQLDAAGLPHIATVSNGFLISTATFTIDAPLFICCALSKSTEAGLPIFGVQKDGNNYARINNVSSGGRAVMTARETGIAAFSATSQNGTFPTEQITIVSGLLVPSGLAVDAGDEGEVSQGEQWAETAITDCAIAFNTNSLTSGSNQVVRFYGGIIAKIMPTPDEARAIRDFFSERVGLL